MAATLGLRAHSGWAMLVAVAGPGPVPAVIDRRRIELVDPAVPGAKQPYHAAAELDLGEAETLVNRCVTDAARLARQALRAAVDDLHRRGHEVVGCGVVLGSGQPARPLAATLASHALIHTAEGELFRHALVHAAEHCGLPVTGVKEREVWAHAAAEFRLPLDTLQQHIAAIGKRIGPPWRQEEKLAALAAWLALAAKPEPS